MCAPHDGIKTPWQNFSKYYVQEFNQMLKYLHPPQQNGRIYCHFAYQQGLEVGNCMHGQKDKEKREEQWKTYYERDKRNWRL